MILRQSPVTLLQLTDAHVFATPDKTLLGINPWHTLRAVVRHIQESGVRAHATLATGDLTQDHQPAAYRAFEQALRPLPWPLHCLPGNHDHPETLRHTLPQSSQSVIDYGAWRLVLLDTHTPGSEGGHLADAQIERLYQTCDITPGRHVLLAMHHQPVPMGSTWLDTMAIDNAPALFDAIRDLPAIRALVWGHVHQAYDSSLPLADTRRPPLRLLSCPATCFQFLPRSHDFALDTRMPGYRLIHLYPDGRLQTDLIRIPTLPPEAGALQQHSAGY